MVSRREMLKIAGASIGALVLAGKSEARPNNVAGKVQGIATSSMSGTLHCTFVYEGSVYEFYGTSKIEGPGRALGLIARLDAAKESGEEVDVFASRMIRNDAYDLDMVVFSDGTTYCIRG